MRTIKRHSRGLNKGKWETVVAIAEAYASEKDKWLAELSQAEQTEKLRSDRIQRDILVKQKYASSSGLQARQWKQALKDSVETLDKNWKALFVDLKPLIIKNENLCEEQKHYCLWILGSYERLQGVLTRKYPVPGFSVDAQHFRKAGNYLNRIIRRHKAQASLSSKVNNAFNTLYEQKAPAVLITENLRHVLTFNRPKGVNRKLSSWIKGIIQDRAEFKALEGRSLHKQVNPAYGSQTCNHCGFVWNLNRKGDAFKCQFCGHEAGSDQVAAVNCLTRSTDKDIGLHVPYADVKQILVNRFRRRLECWDFDVSPARVNWASVACLFKDWESLRDESAKLWLKRTVAGRTPDTGGPHTSDCVGDKSAKTSRIAGGLTAANTAPVNRRAKRPHSEAKPVSNVM